MIHRRALVADALPYAREMQVLLPPLPKRFSLNSNDGGSSCLDQRVRSQ
jgi:hypothetical protein